VLAMGRNEWKRSARLNAGGGEVELDADCGVREPLDVLLGMSAKMSMDCVLNSLRRAKCVAGKHTTHCTISSLQHGVSVVHRSIALAKTVCKHVQTDASWWHFLALFV
jgi:hypothetical protein